MEEPPSPLPDAELAALMRSLRVHSQGSDKYDNVRIGINPISWMNDDLPALGGALTDILGEDLEEWMAESSMLRRTFRNMRQAMVYTLAVHIPIAGLALLPVLFGLPLLLAPLHIAFLELVIDPACSIVFEAEREEDDVMRRPPRPPQESIFAHGLWQHMIWVGLLIGGVAAAPLGAWAAKHFPPKTMLILVGIVLTLTSSYGVYRAWG